MEKAGRRRARIAPVDLEFDVLGLGCWAFGGAMWGGQEDADSLAAMEASLRHGVNHFDTAAGYGSGRSERLVGEFLRGRRSEVFLATKAFPGELTAEYIQRQVEESRQRLQVETIDLFYIHWPRTGKDLRPLMEGLETARSQGRIRAIGVSNFSVEQMEQAGQAGTINAHQLCYNLFWRFPERDVIPYCREKGIAVVTYSSIAQGILAAKFPLHPQFAADDHRGGTVLFKPEVWPHIHDAVERLKPLAEREGRPLGHLAIRWVAEQPGITCVLVGARNARQAEENAAALEGDVASETLAEMTRVSDEAIRHVPDTGNIFEYYP